MSELREKLADFLYEVQVDVIRSWWDAPLKEVSEFRRGVTHWLPLGLPEVPK